MTNIIEKGDYRLKIIQDTDAQYPFDNDEGLGSFYSFHRHSRNRQEGIEALENNHDAVVLSCYSHSGEHWFVKGEQGIQCQWDTAQVAGVWIPNDCLMVELEGIKGQDRKDKCLLFAKQAMGTLNQYLSGDVWGYVIEKKKHCDNCQHDDYEHIDSCWGFYGYEYCEKEACSQLDYFIKEAA